ncbi:FprA family A-type flavoprotein [Saccharicrinis fermentans]|uniref:Nitric oxide reductase n=1 Tax=Saccharicrinis fermentans DSM 9555 = JCM 21142 TaxID=869213 RepID=W7YB49_9BACT|nr:FprA family A-type flavoprotein [Saccharicrinis fermentans]GAF05647.1 nitric oxide reductase [Saccharicrinis fermentans DSM 9555 = JCM 21142]
MYKPVKLTDDVFYVGVNDRRTHLFENIWPIERGVAYNSYVIADEKVALIDSVEIGQVEKYLKKIKAIIGDRPIDYLVVNHMEPDHGGSIDIIRKMYPEIQIVGNKKTLPMLEGYFGISDNTLEIKEGDCLHLGKHTLNFYLVPMVHWPETMVTYESKEQILFSADAFGSFGTLDGAIFDDEFEFEYYRDEMRRYYSNIVGKYGSPVQKALDKLANLDIKMIASTHGPIWRKYIKEVINYYDKWSKYETEEGVVVAYASMYGNTEEMAEAVARELAENGIKHIRVHDVSKSHASFIISDIFKYRGVILASPTYCNELHPNMEALTSKLVHMGVQNHYLGILGSFSWSGAAVKKLTAIGEQLKWEIVGESVEEKHALKSNKYDACLKLGTAMADRLKQDRK